MSYRSPSETHSHLEKEFAFQNDGFIIKLLKTRVTLYPSDRGWANSEHRCQNLVAFKPISCDKHGPEFKWRWGF